MRPNVSYLSSRAERPRPPPARTEARALLYWAASPLRARGWSLQTPICKEAPFTQTATRQALGISDFLRLDWWMPRDGQPQFIFEAGAALQIAVCQAPDERLDPLEQLAEGTWITLGGQTHECGQPSLSITSAIWTRSRSTVRAATPSRRAASVTVNPLANRSASFACLGGSTRTSKPRSTCASACSSSGGLPSATCATHEAPRFRVSPDAGAASRIRSSMAARLRSSRSIRHAERRSTVAIQASACWSVNLTPSRRDHVSQGSPPYTGPPLRRSGGYPLTKRRDRAKIGHA